MSLKNNKTARFWPPETEVPHDNAKLDKTYKILLFSVAIADVCLNP